MRAIQVKVKPNARVSALERQPDDGTWFAKIKAQPGDGKAQVSIRSGTSGHTKLLQIEG